MELNEFDIRYKPRDAIKAQVLANFITEFTLTKGQQSEEQRAKQWVIHVDGSSTQHVGGIWIVLHLLEGDHLKYKIRLLFQKTNNKAEYEALLQHLQLAKSLGANSVLVQGVGL